MAKKKKTVKKPPKKSEKQTYIEGTEPPRIEALDDAALEFKEIRDEWQAKQLEMMEAKGVLLEMMQEHQDELAKDSDGNTVYPIPDTEQEVTLSHGEDNVKVRKRKKVKEAE